MATQRRPINLNDHIAGIARTLVQPYAKWESLWNENASLQSARKHPNMLFHGVRDPQTPSAWKHPPDEYQYEDDPAQRNESAATGSHTSFVTGACKIYLRLRVVDETYTPFAGARYELTLGGITIDPATLTPDGSGVLTVEYPEAAVPAAGGLLKVFYRPPTPSSAPSSASPPAEVCIQYTLSLGRLDPINDLSPAGDNFTSGVQQRLNNLGLNAGEVSGINNPGTEAAIRQFQSLCAIAPAEESAGRPVAGPRTLEWLEKLHDKPGKPADAAPRPAATQPVSVPISVVTTTSAMPTPVNTPVGVTTATGGTRIPPALALANAEYKAAKEESERLFEVYKEKRNPQARVKYQDAKQRTEDARKKLEALMNRSWR
jgi:peptidoglycan hydrolase-like protein with peptidoglycan-binding domain